MARVALGVKLVLLLHLGLGEAASIAFERQGAGLRFKDSKSGFFLDNNKTSVVTSRIQVIGSHWSTRVSQGQAVYLKYRQRLIRFN